MNTKFQIQIHTVNFGKPCHTISKDISLTDIHKFTDLASAINKNSGGKIFNWFENELPVNWDGKRYVIDTWRLCNHMKENFDYKVEDINLIKEFFLRFTPNGCDGIKCIKFFKVEEIDI